MLDFIPDMAWFVFWSGILLISVFFTVFAPKVTAWDNENIIAKGKDEKMTASEIKRTIKSKRHFFGLLFLVAIVNFATYFRIVFGG